MFIKRSGGKIFGAIFTAAETKAMNIEINRQILEADTKYSTDVDAMILWVLHSCFGFGKKRLKRFYDEFSAEHQRLREYYEMPDDGAWLCKHKLKDIGVDVDKWNDERSSL